jgi:hypothetical protein
MIPCCSSFLAILSAECRMLSAALQTSFPYIDV